MPNADMGNMTDHYPHRGDQIEAWIKDRRDQFENHKESMAGTDYMSPYDSLDSLLDEYREAADLGYTLDEVVNGPEQVVIETRKPKKG